MATCFASVGASAASRCIPLLLIGHAPLDLDSACGINPDKSPHQGNSPDMARWPRHTWTTLLTYGSVFILFPVLALLSYAYVQGWLF